MIAGGQGGAFTLISHSQLYQRIDSHIQKLSSGRRITGAADDPAGLAVAEKMESHIRALKREVMNDEDYRNFLNYREALVAENLGHLQRIRELAVQAAGGILTRSDRELLQFEVEQLLDQIDGNGENGTFNTVPAIPGLNASSLGLADLSLVENPSAQLAKLDAAQTKLLGLRTRSGVHSATLELQIEGKQYYMLNLQSAESAIRDLDMAAELVELSRDAVLYKSATGFILLDK